MRCSSTQLPTEVDKRHLSCHVVSGAAALRQTPQLALIFSKSASFSLHAGDGARPGRPSLPLVSPPLFQSACQRETFCFIYRSLLDVKLRWPHVLFLPASEARPLHPFTDISGRLFVVSCKRKCVTGVTSERSKRLEGVTNKLVPRERTIPQLLSLILLKKERKKKVYALCDITRGGGIC